MKNDKLKEFIQTTNTTNTTTSKQKIFADIVQLTEYVKKINQQLRVKLKNRNENS